MKLKSCQRGIGLTETIMSAGIVGVIALGIAKIMEGGYKNNSDLSVRQEAREFKDQFYMTIKKDNCGLTPPNVSLDTQNILLESTSSAQINIPKLYSAFGQEINQGDQFGRLSIAKTEGFKITPPSQNSPYIKYLPSSAKTSGGYYLLNDEIVGEIIIKMQKPTSAGGGVIPLNYIAFFGVDPSTKKITSCRSLAEISSAKESCESISSTDSKSEFSWNDSTMSCEVTIHTLENSSGNLNYNDSNNVSNDYVLSQIP